eukprot:gnl/MRDRNA2_/MRDRNA2_72571_c0_seq1.p1 gnl/MRDRNA2_/MRDRNA2_72571_c0~~gnl/MRDRNA2_/MRDRNA2_72571_c0_seq1.p1  ORF type:complete len:358 (+),score=84.14 gnl/MRDRNA2_/MRDRNA2_72571_c0_seq1:48-1121(+)
MLIGTPVGSVSVTVGDLSAAIAQFNQRLDEQKQWTQNELQALEQKIHAQSEYMDNGLGSYLDKVHAQVSELKKSHSGVEQLHSNFEERAGVAHATLTSLLEETQQNCVKLVNDSHEFLQGVITTTSEALQEQINIIDAEKIPKLRKAFKDANEEKREQDEVRFLRVEKALGIDLADITCAVAPLSNIPEALLSVFPRMESLEKTSRQLRTELAAELKTVRREIQESVSPLFVMVRQRAIEEKEAHEHKTRILTDSQSELDTLREAHDSHKEGTAESIDMLAAEVHRFHEQLDAIADQVDAKFSQMNEAVKYATEQGKQMQQDLSEVRASTAKAVLNSTVQSRRGIERSQTARFASQR